MPQQVSQSNSVPPPPPGYTLDSVPPPPAGYALDSPQVAGAQAALSQPPTESEFLGFLKEFFPKIGKGAIKSLAQTAVNSPVGPLAMGIPATPAGEQAPQLKQLVQPQGAAEHIGAALEQAGEMTAAGGPLRSVATGALTRLPFLGRYMAPGARVAAESINAASNASAHNQDPNAAALAGGIGQGIAEGAPYLVPFLRKSAEEQYSKILNPTTQRNKNITQDVVPQLLDKNVVSTEGGLLKKATKHVGELGQDINTAVSNVPSSVRPQTQNVVNSLEKYKQQYIVNGVPVNQGAVSAASDLQDMVKSLGPDVSYQSLNRVRQILDSSVSKAGGYTGKSLAEGSIIDAQREAANAIRRELASQSPDIAKINAEFHLWRGVQDVMQATIERRTGQAGGLIHNLLPWMAGAAGLAHGGMTPHGGLESIAAASLMLAVDNGLRSGVIRSLSAVGKSRLADLISSGNTQGVVQFLKNVSAAGASQLPAH